MIYIFKEVWFGKKNNWVKQQLLLAKAQINLEDNQVDFEELVKKLKLNA